MKLGYKAACDSLEETPEKLKIIANKNNFKLDETVGMKFNPLSKKWSKSNDVSVNYISTFFKS